MKLRNLLFLLPIITLGSVMLLRYQCGPEEPTMVLKTIGVAQDVPVGQQREFQDTRILLPEKAKDWLYVSGNDSLWHVVDVDALRSLTPVSTTTTIATTTNSVQLPGWIDINSGTLSGYNLHLAHDGAGALMVMCKTLVEYTPSTSTPATPLCSSVGVPEVTLTVKMEGEED